MEKSIFWRNALIEKIDSSMNMESDSYLLFSDGNCKMLYPSVDCQETLESHGPQHIGKKLRKSSEKQ